MHNQKRLVRGAVNGALVCEGRGHLLGPGKAVVGKRAWDGRAGALGRRAWEGTASQTAASWHHSVLGYHVSSRARGCGGLGLEERALGGVWGRGLACFFHGRLRFLRSRPRVIKLLRARCKYLSFVDHVIASLQLLVVRRKVARDGMSTKRHSCVLIKLY